MESNSVLGLALVPDTWVENRGRKFFHFVHLLSIPETTSEARVEHQATSVCVFEVLYQDYYCGAAAAFGAPGQSSTPGITFFAG